MKNLLAGAILSIMLLLGTPIISPMVASAATAEVACELASNSGLVNGETETENEEAEDDAEEKDKEVLGEKRDDGSGMFITGVEIAICIIFVVGLISAGKSGYEK
ncbi:MAG: hypothetical protein E7302_02490 [Butyrivibrio sp.]|nr:hypothetical protein [Butyrivibrio sp.]